MIALIMVGLDGDTPDTLAATPRAVTCGERAQTPTELPKREPPSKAANKVRRVERCTAYWKRTTRGSSSLRQPSFRARKKGSKVGLAAGLAAWLWGAAVSSTFPGHRGPA